MAISSRVDKYTIQSKKSIAFSDIPIDFNKNLDTNDLLRVLNESAVKRSLRNLISTNKLERFFQPGIGSDVRALLFENATPQTEQAIRTAIENTIRNHEPRVEVLGINIVDDSDNNRYRIDITFRVIQISETMNLNVFLYRVR